MKKLKKILLINWLYYSRQLIDIGDINFLTGKTGAGKSTIIDALQIVLLGELNARNFNKAANESSQRTLDGYLRADIDGTGEGTRRGKDFSSYIACEFYDDWQGNSFTIGIIFDCRNDGSRQERFFIYPGKIPETVLSSTNCRWIFLRFAPTLPASTSPTEKCTTAIRTTRRTSSRGGTFTRRLSSEC